MKQKNLQQIYWAEQRRNKKPCHLTTPASLITAEVSLLFFPTIRPLKMLSPLKNVASTTMRQYVIRIRKQGKQWKVERDESAGNVTAVVAVLAPAAGAVSKTHSARAGRCVRDNNCISLSFGFVIADKREAIYPLLERRCCSQSVLVAKLMESRRVKQSCTRLERGQE